MQTSIKGFIEKNEYIEKGRRKKTRDTLLIRIAPSVYDKITDLHLEKIIKWANCKHVVVQTNDNAEIEEFDSLQAGLLIVVDLDEGSELYLSRGLIACGCSQTLFICDDNVKLYAQINEVIASVDNRHMKVTLNNDDSGVSVESLFFDEDRFEKFTMDVARAVAPFCPKVISRYAYLPTESNPKYAYELNKQLKVDGYLPYPTLKKESYLPLKGNRDVIVAKVGLQRLAVTEENK